jgi:Rps23 Pro-64 3,4-dihydroxylase Tpa1-like proline 4-hydroxylase
MVPFHFDSGRLLPLASARHQEYVSAEPFPHIVIDDFLPEEVLDGVLAEFPSPDAEAWLRFESENERKLASQRDTPMGDATRHLLAEFNSAPFIEFLETLTGIGGLVPDPHFEGGGMHQIVRGGHLNVHVDFNKHPRTGLERRLNALIYLNRDWQPEYGGALGLWNPDGTRELRTVLPMFNRLVVFSTTETSYHGHPEPLNCPAGMTRKSLALYYYSASRAEQNGSGNAHNTVWRPERPSRERVKTVVRAVAPPVLYDLARQARRRSRASA